MGQSIEKFIESRRPRWERLEYLIQSLERGKAKPLKGSELPDIGRLYREATADLARLQAFQQEGSLPEELVDYLNSLVARAHGQIYRSPSPGWSKLWGFLRTTFPATFRETAPWTLFALGIFGLGFAYGLIAGLIDDTFIPLIAPPHLIQQVEEGKVWFDSILAIRPLASSLIMTNNISVTFMAFALGMTFGLGTIYIMAFNGLLLGTLAALCHLHGLDVDFWSFVLPHGVIELTTIFIAGGGGLFLGSALLAPGDLSRKEALVQRGRKAVQLILGCVPLLILAGIVEGFFSPSHLPPWSKFILAALLLALLLCYLLLPPPHRRPRRLTSK
ncbi:MAG: stage II sporulation protein M [Syntrophobacterales bacterium]|jgi:uncharacterized membrane protein SpoIIM required for sporulation